MKSDGFKWWHAALGIAAVAAVAWGVFRIVDPGRETVKFASELLYVDVTTGGLFRFDVTGRRSVPVPAPNPDSGEYLLLGVEKRDDGKWYIRERHLPLLASIKAPATAVTDPQTGEVRVAEERPRAGRP